MILNSNPRGREGGEERGLQSHAVSLSLQYLLLVGIMQTCLLALLGLVASVDAFAGAGVPAAKPSTTGLCMSASSTQVRLGWTGWAPDRVPS